MCVCVCGPGRAAMLKDNVVVVVDVVVDAAALRVWRGFSDRTSDVDRSRVVGWQLVCWFEGFSLALSLSLSLSLFLPFFLSVFFSVFVRVFLLTVAPLFHGWTEGHHVLFPHPVEFFSCLPGFYRVFTGFLPGLTQLNCWVNGFFLFCVTGFGWSSSLLIGFYPVLLSSTWLTGFYWVLLGFTGFYWVLRGFTKYLLRFYQVLLGFTDFTRLLDFTGVLQGFTGFYRVFLVSTDFYWFKWLILGFTEFYRV